MFPLALDSSADALTGSEEQVILYLDKFRTGSPLPKNVLEDINPYQFRPSNLPDGIWYIVHSTEKKENEFGFWEVKEEASEIFTNSSISGWRTAMEFFELQDSVKQRTNWVMQEYRIRQKGECGTNKEKELRAMCRVFLSAARCSNEETNPKPKGAVIEDRNHDHAVPSTRVSIGSISKKGSTSGSLTKHVVDGTTLLSEADKLLDPWIRDPSGLDDVLNGNYLELDDLADPQSHSSSSDNSSCSSMTCDEYFDPIALLQELENNNDQGQQGRDSSSRFQVTASKRPSEVVLLPATSGSLACATGTQQPTGCKLGSSVMETKFLDGRVADHTVKRLKAEQRDEGPSCPRSVVASSSTTPTIPNGKKKAVVKTKRLKKYLCFMPF